MSDFLNEMYQKARQVAEELCERANLQKGSIVVVGCSSSEVNGKLIGTYSSIESAEMIFRGINEVLVEKEIYLAAQCCEHLNRAIIIEGEAAHTLEKVNVIPQPKAGGSFAVAAYKGFKQPVAVEFIKADAGIDIGGTLIGMHLKHVAVPIRLSVKQIGEAHLVAARTRSKCIGGIRAIYDETLM